MKKINISISLFSACMLLISSSCESVKQTSNKNKGIAVGAASGAVIGGVIGNNVGNKNNTALGAILGAAIGGVAGGLIGNNMDKQAEKIKSEVPGANVERVGEGINVTFDENNPDGSKAGVYFKTNESTISSNSELALKKLQKIFAEYPDTNILIEGHTDNVGSESSNLLLSKKRAIAAEKYLQAEGLASNRLITKWYGESQPKVENSSDENKATNRRVQFVITANEKMKEQAKKIAQ